MVINIFILVSHNYNMTVEAALKTDYEVKQLQLLRDGSSKFTLPNKYVLKLGYKHKDELTIILYNDKLMILDEQNYKRVKPQKGAKIKKTTLSGYQTKRTFVYQIFINKEYIQDLKIEGNTALTIYLKEYGLIVGKYE